jgi:hypothetical protein
MIWMRTSSLILALALLLTLAAAVAPAIADTGSISRDSRGTSTYGMQDPLGGPPTPRVYGLGQPTIFAAGITLLVVAAALGAYTLMTARRTDHRR